MTLCYVNDNCTDTPTLTKGLCTKHYQRNKRHGSPYLTKKPPRGLSREEFLEWRGWTVSESGCWEINGARDRDGYAHVNYAGKAHKAHRFAYETWVGPIPEGHLVRHKCDNPCCINPNDLETGTDLDNVHDMISRGRQKTLLTVEQVREARMLRETTSMTIQEIADHYNVGHPCMVAVIYRRSWKNV